MEKDFAADLKTICFECGAHCCKLGGVVATQNEVDAIVVRGHPNHFVQLAKDVYGTEWGENGSCAYLMNGKCSIHSVRPLGCRLFPVVQNQKHDVTLVECPLSSHLFDDEIIKRIGILKQRPMHILRESEHLREHHIKEVKIRASRYSHQSV